MVRRDSETLTRLRALLAEQAPALNERVPPERSLSEAMGVTRGELRKAMAVLEAEGQIWRHVGRGTFIGARPVLNLGDVRYLGSITSRAQILDARLALEPELARLAAVNGVKVDIEELRLCDKRCREAKIWRVYEAWDYRFHFAIASATKNKLLIALFETLNAVRRTLTAERPHAAPPADYEGFAEHDAILKAISHHDAARAVATMRAHLFAVRERQLTTPIASGDHTA